MFNHAFNRTCIHIVTDTKSIIHQKKNPRDDIFHQCLGAKTDSQADDPRTGNQRPDVNTDRRSDTQSAHGHQHGQHKLSKQQKQRPDAGTAGAALLLFFLIIRHFLAQSDFDAGVDQFIDHIA